MSKYRLLILASLCAAQTIHAQSFKNGSFEPIAGTKACDYLYNNQFSNGMNKGIYAFGNTAIGGTVGKIYLESDTCGGQSAKEGTHFVSLSSNDMQADAIAMELTSPLVANKNYTVQFYNKKGMPLVPIGLEVGYSNDTSNFGTLIGSCPVPTDTNWTLQSFTFKPTSSSKYITLRGVKTTVIGYSMTPVDAFSLRFAADVAEAEHTFSLTPYPNPFTEYTQLQLDADIKLPCSMELTDLTGKIIRKEEEITKRNTVIKRADLPAGTYLLKIKDNTQKTYCTKLIAI